MVNHGFVLDFSRRKLLLADQLMCFEEHPAAASVTFYLSSLDSSMNKGFLSVNETRKEDSNMLRGKCCPGEVAKPNSKAGYNFKALSYKPTYLSLQFVHLSI